MKVLNATKNNIKMAAKIIKSGGVVVYPTDTVYGLGCDPLNVEAVKKIIKVKNHRNKPLPILTANMKGAQKVATISANGKKLATEFWPGPLTMVFPKKITLPDIVTLGWDSVGLRIPNNKIALQLIRLSGGLLVGSSANLTGEEPPKNIDEISSELKKNVDIVLDGGPSMKGESSTVIDLTSKKIKLLRKGPISYEAILSVLTLND